MTTEDNRLKRSFYHYLTLGEKENRGGLLLQYLPEGYEMKEEAF